MEVVERSTQPLKPSVNIVFHWIGSFYFWLRGWKIVGTVPQNKKYIAIVAPHTSNMDGVMVLFTSWVIRRRLDWTIKIEWTRRPVIGWFLRYMGAIGVDRSASMNLVQQLIEKIHAADEILLAIPPEGTRRKTNHWKTGFYWIAVGANIPMLPVRVDYTKRTVDLDVPLLMPSGDIDADMAVIWSYYEGVQGHHPDQFSDMKIRPSGKRPLHNDNPFEKEKNDE